MIRKHKAKDGTITYGVRVYRNGERVWVGSFPRLGAAHGDPRTEARAAEARALSQKPRAAMTVADYAERYLDDYERQHKPSSTDTARSRLKAFLRDFGRRELASLTRIEAKDWSAAAKPSQLPPVVALLNAAVEDELLERNPFRGLGSRSKGRSEQAPPTEAEFDKLLQSCSVHGHYAPMLRSLLSFAAYSGMRPGELFALEWADVDFDAMRVQVERRLYRGKLDLPKSGQARTIVLTPPARDAILGLPRTSHLVFTAKRGGGDPGLVRSP